MVATNLPADALVFITAVSIELLIGDPISRWHPVALFGTIVDKLMARAPSEGQWKQLLYGAMAVTLTVVGVTLGSALLLRAGNDLSPLAAVLLGGILLKVTFSYRQLEGETLKVAHQIELGSLVGARES